MTPTHAGGLLFRSAVFVAGVGVAAYLLVELRSLIVPVAVAGLFAYVGRPLVAAMERYRFPRDAAVGMLLLLFVLSSLFIVTRIREIVPTDVQAAELKVEMLHKINERYKALMGLDESLARGNRLYRIVHRDVDPLLDRVNHELALTPEERAALHASRPRRHDASTASDRLLDHDRANRLTLTLRARTAPAAPEAMDHAPPALAHSTTLDAKRPLTMLADVLSTWLVAPLVFLFLLRDTGEMKRGFLAMVPNRLFEPALTILDDLDRAVGSYVRGIVLEGALLGSTLALLLALVGIPPRWAIAIGLLAAATNVVPYAGFAIAVVGALGYVVMADEIRPLLPFVERDDLWIWVVVAVAFAELLKNVIYEPLVLGGAVKLHPLVMVIGVFGGATLFGVVGLLLAIPTIVVLKVFVSSMARQVKAYGLIH